MKTYKKLARHLVTFEGHADSMALAKLGQSNNSIRRSVALTNNQITYRLSKAKKIEENDRGYRMDFRNGTSPLVQQLIKDMASVLQADIRRDLPKAITHPTPETTK